MRAYKNVLMLTDEELYCAFQRCKELGAIAQVLFGSAIPPFFCCAGELWCPPSPCQGPFLCSCPTHRPTPTSHVRCFRGRWLVSLHMSDVMHWVNLMGWVFLYRGGGGQIVSGNVDRPSNPSVEFSLFSSFARCFPLPGFLWNHILIPQHGV